MNIPSTRVDQAAAIFRRLKGKNIITPHVVAYFMQGDYAVEISQGEGMDHRSIFGVTFMHKNSLKETDHKRSKMLESLEDAIRYARTALD